ncbi:MAG: C39 family peptidase, partial [Synergistaceae bacterium]|nr:C39 family peptidase [Synergistaceae bacterium]
MQLETLECGVASLAMVLAYFGLWIPLEQLRKDCGVSRDGSNLKSIYRAAKKYGLTPHAFKCDAESLKHEAAYPCIVFWEYNHFVVLDGFKKDRVYLNDPARGKITITFEEFSRSYSGVYMTLEPSPDFQPGGKPASILKFALQRLTGTLPVFLMVIMTTLIASLSGILMPAFSRFFVDHLLTRSSPQWAGGFFVLLGLVILSQVLSLVIKAVYMLRLQGKMAAVANTSFLWHILRLPVEFFEQRMAG